MEIRIEAADGFKMPSDSYVAVKLGEALKQGRYDPTRGYVFPKANTRLYAKIDIFKHVGSESVLVNPEAGSSAREIDITSKDPSFGNMKFRVGMKPVTTDKVSPKRSKSTVRDQAAAYLEKHKIEERLSSSMKALLQSQPEDPIKFFCCSLQGIPCESVAESSPEKNNRVDERTYLNDGTNPAEKNTCREGSTDETMRDLLEEPITAGSNSKMSELLQESRDAEETREDPIDFNSVRRALASASNDGTLFDLLQEGRTESTNSASLSLGAQHNKVDESDKFYVDKLCSRAAEVLLQASQSGTLREVIASSRIEVHQGSKIEGTEEGDTDKLLATLKEKALMTLTSATLNGRIQDYMARASSQALSTSCSPLINHETNVSEANALETQSISRSPLTNQENLNSVANVHEARTMDASETSRKHIILGLADAARVTANSSPVSAAGLANAAAEVAESFRASLGTKCSISSGVVTGLAEMAVSAASVGSASAPGLIEAVVAACTLIAETND